MGWDVVIHGSLALKDARAITALRKAAFIEAPELASGPSPFAHEIHRAPATVGEAIASMVDHAFSIDAERGRLSIAGVWTEDGLRDHAATLARVISIAGRRGATGEVELVALGPTLAFRLSASASGVEVAALSEPEHATLANAPWVADLVERAADAALASLGPAPTVATSAPTEADPIDRALARLAALDDATLHACANDLPPGVSVRIKGRPVDQAWVKPADAFSDGAALRAALFAPLKKGEKRGPDDWRRAFALPALAHHAPAEAEPLAIAVLRDPPSVVSMGLRQSAAHALGRSPTEAAVEALFAALGTSALAGFALQRNTHPSIVARAIAVLDDAAVAQLYATASFPGAYLTTAAAELVMLLGQKGDPAAAPRLLEVWRRRGRAAGALVVGGALAALGLPETLAAVSECIGDLDVGEGGFARMGGRAFLRMDPASAFERAQAFFFTEDPVAARSGAAILSALEPGPGLDPRWTELARRIEAPPNVKAAAHGWLRRAPSSAA